MPLVAFILGAGTNIGQHVASALKEKGYAIAFGSRNPDVERVRKDGFIPIAVDVTNSDSIKTAFDQVKKELGAPNVVVYNPASFSPPQDPSDPLTLPIDTFTEAVSFGTGVFASAQQALPGFRSEEHKSNPRAFIVTGNLLPYIPPIPLFVGLGTQKWMQRRLVEEFSNAYAKDGIRFYFASLVGLDGGRPPSEEFMASGSIHGEVYLNLINGQNDWDYRFTIDGKKYQVSN